MSFFKEDPFADALHKAEGLAEIEIEKFLKEAAANARLTDAVVQRAAEAVEVAKAAVQQAAAAAETTSIVARQASAVAESTGLEAQQASAAAQMAGGVAQKAGEAAQSAGVAAQLAGTPSQAAPQILAAGAAVIEAGKAAYEAGKAAHEAGKVVGQAGAAALAASAAANDAVAATLSAAALIHQLGMATQQACDADADSILTLEKLIEDVRNRRDRLHIQPEFTLEIVGVCKQILAFGAAGIGILVAFSDKIQTLSPVWIKITAIGALFYVNLTITALLVLCWFLLQARSRYPFLFLEKTGNTTPYFYYETLGRDWHWRPIGIPKTIFEDGNKYLRDFCGFVEHLSQETLIKRARNELQQYYLLVVYQGYLDQYELQLTHLFLYCAIGGTVIALVCGFFMF